MKSRATIEGSSKIPNIPSRYKKNPDNVPDTLESQIEVLRNLGFENVDCVFKFGIFSLYVGSRPEEKITIRSIGLPSATAELPR